MKKFIAILILCCINSSVALADGDNVKGEAVIQCDPHDLSTGGPKAMADCQIFIEIKGLDTSKINSCYGRVIYNYIDKNKEIKTAYRGFLTEFKNKKVVVTSVAFTKNERALSPKIHWVNCNPSKLIK